MRRWRVPLWLALVGLACVPTIGLVGVSARIAADRADAAAHARSVAASTAELRVLVGLRFAVTREAFPLQALPAIAVYGIDEDLAQRLLGMDLRSLALVAIADVDRLVQQVDDAAIVDDVVGLRPLREQALAGSADLARLGPEYSAVERHLGAAIDRAVARLRMGAAGSGSRELARQLLVLADVLEAQRAGQSSLSGLASLVVPDVGPRRPPSQLATDWGSFQRAALAVDASDLGRVQRAWEDFRASADTLLFESAVQRTLDATYAGTGVADAVDLEELASVFAAGLRRSEALRRIGERVADQVQEEVRAIAEASEAAHRRTVAAAAAVVIVSLGAAIGVAVVIVRPLRRLARAATAVRDGALDVPHPPPSVLREVAVVSAAFDEMLANLRAVEVQAGALAAGRLDADVLQHPVPGRLGDAVQASVAQLSSSLVERDRLQRRLAHEASHDALTGLPNRAAAVVALEEAVASGRRTAVLFIDLDEFKRANDTHGHIVGDAVLRGVASTLLAQVRRGDRVARLGGDEFLVVADVTEVGEAVGLGERIVDAVSEPMVVEGVPVSIGASVGIAVSDERSTALDLLRDADVAVYEAKRAGKRRVEVLGEDLRRVMADRADLERNLQTAVRARTLDLHYQPVVALGGAPAPIERVEALVRWPLEDGRTLAASAFVRDAEAAGLAIALGTAVLDRAIVQLVEWDEAPGHPLGGVTMAVNLSRAELFHPDLPANLAAALEQHGVAPARLTLEVAEATLVRDLAAAAEPLAALRALGCQVAVDDFGLGTTAMGVLQLPIDVLKLDRTLVSDLHQPRQRTLAELVVDAAHGLGITVVAEGVESGEQAAMLAACGCDDAQGYWFAEPMPAGDLTLWAGHRARTVVDAG